MIEAAAVAEEKKILHQQLGRDEEVVGASGKVSRSFTDLCLAQGWRRVAVT